MTSRVTGQVSPEEFKHFMSSLCQRNGLTLSEEKLELFYKYLEELLRWNRVHNLTGLDYWKDIVTRHFCDSLTPVKFFEDIGYNPSGKRLVDVGSGAGFPGVPLKIYYGNALDVHLVENVSKKCSFLTFLKRKLGLHYTVHCTDAQNLKEKFEIAITRALEVKGKKIDPLNYADRLLTRLATELAVILKGKEVDPQKAQQLGYKIYELTLPDFKGLKILYKFLTQ